MMPASGTPFVLPLGGGVQLEKHLESDLNVYLHYPNFRVNLLDFMTCVDSATPGWADSRLRGHFRKQRSASLGVCTGKHPH